MRAATTVACAEVSGAELHSTELEFRPGVVNHGDYTFAVGTAGSCTLVFQTVLWPLLVAPGRSHLVFEGGTHNPLAPPFDPYTDLLLSSVPEMEIGWLDKAIASRRMESAGN